MELSGKDLAPGTFACASAVHVLVLSRVDTLLEGMPGSSLHLLQGLQNDAGRTVTRTSRREHITPVLEGLHWLPVRERIHHRLLTVVYRTILKPSAPSYLTLRVCQAAHSLRSSVPLQLEVWRTQTHPRSFI